MRFLLDQNISPKVAEPMRTAGHDVTVAREVGLSRASDDVVMATARAERRVLVSADTDFGAILARTRAASPSFVLMRRAANERPMEHQQQGCTPVIAVDDAVMFDGVGRMLARRTRRLLLGAWCGFVLVATVTYLAVGDVPRAVGTGVVGLLAAAVAAYPDQGLRTGLRRR